VVAEEAVAEIVEPPGEMAVPVVVVEDPQAQQVGQEILQQFPPYKDMPVVPVVLQAVFTAGEVAAVLVQWVVTVPAV